MQINITVLYVASYYFMMHRAVTYFILGTDIYISIDGMVSSRIIRTQYNILRGVRKCSTITNIVSRGNRNDSWELIWGIEVSFVWYVNFIKRYGR